MKGLRHDHSAVLLPLLAAFLFLFSQPSRAENIADLPQPTDYVSDDAHVLSPEAIARLDSICSQLDHSNANSQIAVVTVHDLNGDDAADFADQLETKWKIGKKGSDKGVLVLLAVADHKYRIEVGYGLEGILPDGKVGDIGRAMVPDLRASDYDGAITLAVGQVAQVIAADAGVTLQDQPAPEAAPPPEKAPSAFQVLKGIIIALVIIFYLVRVLGRFGLFGAWGLGLLAGGGRGGFGGGGFSGGGGSFGGGGASGS